MGVIYQQWWRLYKELVQCIKFHVKLLNNLSINTVGRMICVQEMRNEIVKEKGESILCVYIIILLLLTTQKLVEALWWNRNKKYGMRKNTEGKLSKVKVKWRNLEWEKSGESALENKRDGLGVKVKFKLLLSFEVRLRRRLKGKVGAKSIVKEKKK